MGPFRLPSLHPRRGIDGSCYVSVLSVVSRGAGAAAGRRCGPGPARGRTPCRSAVYDTGPWHGPPSRPSHRRRPVRSVEQSIPPAGEDARYQSVVRNKYLISDDFDTNTHPVLHILL